MNKKIPSLILFTIFLSSQNLISQDIQLDCNNGRHRTSTPLVVQPDSSQKKSAEIVSEINADYKLKWQDDFTGTKLDETSNWSIEVNGNGGGNSELQYFRRENISIGQEPITGTSCLIITGKKENYLTKTCTSGRLTTQNKMSFQYGKLEARIKLPKTANGLWPAFWLLGSDVATQGWPKCGEIDILEMGNSTGIKNNTQEKLFNGACHWGYFENGWYPNYAKATTNPYSLQDDFHLYTITWDSQSIKMYLDIDKFPNAIPYFEMAITNKTTDKDPFYYFNKPFFVIFNLAIGGNFTQLWDIAKITALNNGDVKMYIDYVKLYQTGAADEKFVGKITDVKQIATTNELEIYPNPAENQVHISGNESPFDVTIFNSTGQLVQESLQAETLDTSNLPAGNYLMKITNIQGKTEIHKLIKNNL